MWPLISAIALGVSCWFVKIADSCLKIGVPCANIGQDGERPQLCHTVLQNFVHHFEHHFFGELVAPQGKKRA